MTITSGQYYAAMMDPAGFDDTLIASVPLGTYRAEALAAFFPLVREHHFDADPSKAFTTFIDAMNVVEAYYALLRVDPRAQPPTLEPGWEWRIDMGKSGREYPRIMFQLPGPMSLLPLGPPDVWTTPPYGLLDDKPVPLRINGVYTGEFNALRQIFRLSYNGDSVPLGAWQFLEGLGVAYLEPIDRNHLPMLSRMPNLRAILDQYGLEAIAGLYAARS